MIACASYPDIVMDVEPLSAFFPRAPRRIHEEARVNAKMAKLCGQFGDATSRSLRRELLSAGSSELVVSLLESYDVNVRRCVVR